MAQFFARLVFESCPFGPLLSALAAGFAEFGFDGRLYLTAAGAEYLDGGAQ